MAETVLEIQNAWAGIPSLNNLVPADHVWLDISADGEALPYVVLKQDRATPNYNFTGGYYVWTTFTVTMYAATLAEVDAFQTAIISTGGLLFKAVTPTGKTCFYTDISPSAEQGNAYSGSSTWRLFEVTG